MAVVRRGFDYQAKGTKGYYSSGDGDDQLKTTLDGSESVFFTTSSYNFNVGSESITIGTLYEAKYDGRGGDDVIIGYKGSNLLEGGDGQDDLSGGAGSDTLIGAIWRYSQDSNVDIGYWVKTDDDYDASGGDEYTFVREFVQDSYNDDYVAESSFSKNGTDTIYGYDGCRDVVEVKALSSAVSAIAAAEDLADDSVVNGSFTVADVTGDDLVSYGYVDLSNGNLGIDLDGTAGASDSLNTWFVVQVDDSTIAHGAQEYGVDGFTPTAAPTWQNATSVVLEIGSTKYTITDA